MLLLRDGNRAVLAGTCWAVRVEVATLEGATVKEVTDESELMMNTKTVAANGREKVDLRRNIL